MTHPYLPRMLAAATGLAVLAGLPAGAQVPERPALGTVRGVVWDSTLGEPLREAAVFLFGTPLGAASDAEGRFAIDSVPPGDHTVVFYHARLGELGVSPGPRRVRVDAGGEVLVELGTPSWFTLVASQCLLEGRPQGSATLAGWVGDGATGVTMPNAKVLVSWREPGERELRRVELDTDATGWYRLCAAPGGVPMMASVRFLNLQGLRREVSVPAGGSAEASFLLWELRNGSVSGSVRDAASGQPLEGVAVGLRGTSLGAVTDREGAFRLGDVPPGTYTLMAEHVAYGARADALSVPSGRGISVGLTLDARAVELEPLTVTVDAVPLTERSMGGLVVTREQIERMGSRARDAADIVQALNLPGVIVRRRGDGSLCVGFGPGQARMMAFGSCVSMEVYINGVHAANADMALHIPPESVDRIVLFRPVEAGSLFPINAANGVMVIYTRR